MTNLGDGGSEGSDSTGTSGTDGPCGDLLGGAFDYEFDAADGEVPDGEDVFGSSDTLAAADLLTLWHDERTEEFGAPEYDADTIHQQSSGDGENWQPDRRFDLDADDAWSDFRARIVRKPDGTFDIAPPAPIGSAPPPNADAESTVFDNPREAGGEPCLVCGRATYPCPGRGERLTSGGGCTRCRGPLAFWRTDCDRSLCVGCDRLAEHASQHADDPQASEPMSCTCPPIS